MSPAAFRTPARVLLLTTAGDRAGAEAAMEHVARRLDRRRFEPVLAAPSGSVLFDGWRSSGFEVAGTPAVRRLRDPIETSRAVKALSGLLVDRRIDLLHTHGVAAQLHGGLAARRTGRPVVAHAHDIFDRSWSRNGLLHRLASAVPRAATVAVSGAVAASLPLRLRRGDALTIIPNGVESEQVSPAVPAGGPPLVVWCGRLQRWKGCHLFLEAARRVSDRRRDVRYAVVGGPMFGLDPEYPEQLQLRARELGLTDVVRFVGHVPDARPWLAAAALVVHSAERPDPFPLVVLEAMMQARPIVGFRQGGPAEAVVDGVTGRLVHPLDIEALADAIVDLLGDDAARNRLASGARARAIEQYDAAVMVRRIEDLFARVTASRV